MIVVNEDTRTIEEIEQNITRIEKQTQKINLGLFFLFGCYFMTLVFTILMEYTSVCD